MILMAIIIASVAYLIWMGWELTHPAECDEDDIIF